MKLTLTIMVLSFSFAGLVSATVMEQQAPNSIALSADTIVVGYVGLIVFFGAWVKGMDKERKESASKIYEKMEAINKRLDSLNCKNCEVDK
jgi:hypothetical protein